MTAQSLQEPVAMESAIISLNSRIGLQADIQISGKRTSTSYGLES